MKNQKTGTQQNWVLVSAVLGGVLLVAAAGCIRVNIKLESRQTASLPTGPTGKENETGLAKKPPVHAGNFVPVQATPVGAGAGATVCGYPVSKKVTFTFTANGEELLWQTNPSGTTGFRGTVVDLDNYGAIIPNTHYYLQLFVNSTQKGCCTNVLGSITEVGRNVWVGQPHRFTAFFKPNYDPPAGHQIQLVGVWTP